MPKKLNIIFDAQNDAQNLVSRMAAAVSSVISCEQSLPSKQLFAISGVDLDGVTLVLRAMWCASCSP